MLMPYIYDTTSFSDRLVQLATAEDHELASSLLAGDDTAGEKEGSGSTGNSFYPEHLVIE